MKTKHTPGKWAWQLMGDTYNLTAQHGMREIILGGIEHGSMGYPVLGMCNDKGILRDVDPNHPNAKLIAAAPDLFAACIKQAALMDEAGMIDEDLIKAIQKATG